MVDKYIKIYLIVKAKGFSMAFRGQKRSSDTLDLEVQAVVRPCVGAGN